VCLALLSMLLGVGAIATRRWEAIVLDILFARDLEIVLAYYLDYETESVKITTMRLNS